MKQLAIYARTSTDDQKSGLEAQERALREYLKYKQITDYVEFRDDGVSGMKKSRPQFDRMMQAVRAGEIHTVLVYSFSRFARSRKHLSDALEEFKELGVAFISLTEQIDTNGAIGQFLFAIFAALAQFERDQTAERVKNGLKNARAKGKVLGRPKTIGGKKGGEARPDVRILEEHHRGLPVRAIATLLGVSRGACYRVIKGAI